ncbi:hypothetical protein ASG42_24505 [Rhizobium sp. Leaf391]|uniref:hypothetical protein n=1 Tax=Rhizobium sp. Leaf391 TaxID=1736360 RepID=UPI0007158FB7|nr:hypothetical protein [Rhizobium sp. Leaf391]KQT03176.1 hypothetical protein ASG42_24505 [Rhizobium sp. Leaf391]
MRQTITKIRGLTVNVEIIEIHQSDARGGVIWYHAAIYVQRHGSTKRKLVRKSRLPGAAAELQKEIQRDGIQSFDRITLR